MLNYDKQKPHGKAEMQPLLLLWASLEMKVVSEGWKEDLRNSLELDVPRDIKRSKFLPDNSWKALLFI